MFRHHHIWRRGDSPGAKLILSTYRPLVSGQVDSRLYACAANKNMHLNPRRVPWWWHITCTCKGFPQGEGNWAFWLEPATIQVSHGLLLWWSLPKTPLKSSSWWLWSKLRTKQLWTQYWVDFHNTLVSWLVMSSSELILVSSPNADVLSSFSEFPWFSQSLSLTDMQDVEEQEFLFVFEQKPSPSRSSSIARINTWDRAIGCFIVLTNNVYQQ